MWRVANEETKRVLRRSVLSRRYALTKHECLQWGETIQSRALQLPAYQKSRSIALYSAVQNEVGTDDIFKRALASGRKIYYPRTRVDGAGEFVAVTCAADLRSGPNGSREPAGSQTLLESDWPGLIVFLPGLAFDLEGNRLGRGKGWYDRALARVGDKAVLVGLAYEFQIVEAVPRDIWDQRVHFVISEKRVIDCHAASASLEGSAVNCKEKGVF